MRNQRGVVAVLAGAVLILLLLIFWQRHRQPARAPEPVPVAAAAERRKPAATPAPSLPATPRPAAVPTAAAATPVPPTPGETPEPEPTLTAEESALGPLWLVGTVRGSEGDGLAEAEVQLARVWTESPTFYPGAGQPNFARSEELGRTVTDVSGYYEIALSRYTGNQVKVSAKNHAPAGVMLVTGGIQVTRLADGRRALRRDFDLTAGTSLTGRVVDEEGKPVEGATVALRFIDDSETTDAAGRFSFASLSLQGGLALKLSKPGHAPMQYEEESLPPEKDWLLPRQGGRIDGRVVDARGKPIPGHPVTAYASKPVNMGNPEPISIASVTDGQGQFTIHPLAAGSWRVVAQQPGEGTFGLRGSVHREVALGELQIVEGIELQIPDALTIRGVVVTGAEETPVEGAEVSIGRLLAPSTKPILTDAAGRFELRDVRMSASQWKQIRRWVMVRREGYLDGKLPDSDTPWADESAAAAPAVSTIEEKITLLPADMVLLSGRTVDREGRPVADVVVVVKQFSEERALTDARGRFSLRALRNSSAALRAFPPDGPDAFHPLIEVKETPIAGIEFVLDPGGVLEITVLDPDGRPVEGAEVGVMRRTYWENRSSASHRLREQTNREGRATFRGLPSADATMDPELRSASLDAWATHQDFDEVETRDIRLLAGTTTRQELRLPPKGQATADGYVVDQDGKPIEGAVVQLQGTRVVSLTTDSLGFFHAENLLPGKTTVVVSHPGHHHQHEFLEIPFSGHRITMNRR